MGYSLLGEKETLPLTSDTEEYYWNRSGCSIFNIELLK